jgi:hypothetical protein
MASSWLKSTGPKLTESPATICAVGIGIRSASLIIKNPFQNYGYKIVKAGRKLVKNIWKLSRMVQTG